MMSQKDAYVEKNYPGLNPDLIIDADMLYKKMEHEQLDVLQEYSKAIKPKGRLDKMFYLFNQKRRMKDAVIDRILRERTASLEEKVNK